MKLAFHDVGVNGSACAEAFIEQLLKMYHVFLNGLAGSIACQSRSQ